jgi:hypothetical protein
VLYKITKDGRTSLSTYQENGYRPSQQPKYKITFNSKDLEEYRFKMQDNDLIGILLRECSRGKHYPEEWAAHERSTLF